MARKPEVGQLREDAASALERGKLDKAIELYLQLEAAEPTSPTWSKKVGEIHRRAGQTAAAVAAFERAAQRYAMAGFLVQAIAVCKMILQIDPNHSATQVRLSELMPKPAGRPVVPLRADTAPLVYGDDSDDPVREAPPPGPIVMIQTSRRTETVPTARTSSRELADAAARAANKDRVVTIPPAVRTSTRERNLAAAAALARADNAAARAARARGDASPAAPRVSTRDRDLAAAAIRAEEAARASSGAPPVRTTTRDRDLAAIAARARDDEAALITTDAPTTARPSVARTSTRERDLAAAAALARADEVAARAAEVAARTTTRERALAAAVARARADEAAAQPAPPTARTSTLERKLEAAALEAMMEVAPPTARTSTRERDGAVRPPAGPPARPTPRPVVPFPAPGSKPVAAPRRAAPSLPAMIIDRKPITVEIPPGGGLDQIDLSSLLPGSVPVIRLDGTYSGVHVLPLGDGADLELSLDDAEPNDRVPGPTARRALLTTPLFPQVSPRLLEQLIAQMSLIELAPDEILFREGETGNEMFVISEGEVAVESQGIGELARLGPSAFFGEIALVTDLPRSATIRALTHVELLAIDRGVIREASKASPEVITVLLRFVRDRLIDRITRTSELFAPFTELERQALSAKFELVEVVQDTILITQGERADGLYLVVAGRVEVWRDGERALATLGSGDVFGELSLLAGGGSTANVRATSRVLALRMPASTFQEVIMTHPQVLAYLGELAARRTPRSTADDFVDLRLDMLV